MGRKAQHRRWHVATVDGGVILSRRLPARFDLAVSVDLPPAAPLLLAHQIRQDIWRGLRGLRGFAPAVRVVATGRGVTVTAGGGVAGRFARGPAEASLRAVLDDPDNRARWKHFAASGNHA